MKNPKDPNRKPSNYNVWVRFLRMKYGIIVGIQAKDFKVYQRA